jgi:hypothetical protein
MVLRLCSHLRAHPPPRVSASRHEGFERVIPRPTAERAVGVVEFCEGAAVAEREVGGLEGGEGSVCDARAGEA